MNSVMSTIRVILCRLLLLGVANDLGLYLDGTVIAAGATLYGDWINDLDWVRHIVLFVKTDQTCTILTSRKNRASVEAIANILLASTGLTGGSVVRFTSAAPPVSLLGYSAKFGINNIGAVPTVVAQLYVQLLGL